MNAHARFTLATAVENDPLWYKDAVIYQLHVKSFYDANGDGVGDFAGLMEKLDYIAGLGVNTIWLLPFYPSPRRDDGYDIAEYKAVHPEYGTMADVKRFIRAAHERGMRVITELVINHTSDQHPWFQRARRAKPGSVHRNFYVWSDTDQRYTGTRIIFCDTERSNWTWDDVAGAYFWHRFYSHQPDLNFDNPAVLKAVLDIMRFWLEAGIDGLRLDAVPYLVEREGTSNENLPETHAILKTIRRELDAAFPGRMLLAEANMWPEDTQAYFGEGDECHMAFHFPLMPRMYMAIAQEDRFPITDILRQTPDIPQNCQWAIFLRNHDELTLEMVTDRERDYLWDFYASDKRARINLGIRRRLAPLLQRDRRRIELMKSLLLSMPGTPVIYYGDEIGMGDNIFLGDRDGVRTPMQWSPDRNGGFSKADPATLVLPPIMDPLYGFQAVNVEAQHRDAHSLLNWTRRIVSIRKEHKAFGRGSLRFLSPKNRKSFAYLREHEDETILCVANLSRSPQAFEIDLSEFAGRVPVELMGNSAFPPIGQLTYLLTLPPYGFYWFLLAKDAPSPAWHTPAPEPLPDYTTFVLRGGPEDMITPQHRQNFERDVLPAYLGKRRWFSTKDKAIRSATIAAAASLDPDREMALVEVEAELEGGSSDRYLLPLGIGWDDEVALSLPQHLALARVRRGRRTGYLTDAFALPRFVYTVVSLLRRGESIPIRDGRVSFRAMPALGALEVPDDVGIRWLTAEQSNSSLIVGSAIMLKLFRRLHDGAHPEAEMGRFLTEAGFTNSPTLLGEIIHDDGSGGSRVLGVAQAYVPGEGDAWEWTIGFLARTADDNAQTDQDGSEPLGLYARFIDGLGRRLAEMHLALRRQTPDDAFSPVAADDKALARWRDRVTTRIDRVLHALRERLDHLADEAKADAVGILEREAAIRQHVSALVAAGEGALLHRIHGDLHLGQVLVASGDAVFIDFEGEPAQPLAERRAKDNAWRDVAGMLRSLDYVVAAARLQGGGAPSEGFAAIAEAFSAQMPATLLEAYRDRMAEAGTVAAGAQDEALLELFLIEKAAYEILYEVGNRPEWIGVPLAGLRRLVDKLDREPGR